MRTSNLLLVLSLSLSVACVVACSEDDAVIGDNDAGGEDTGTPTDKDAEKDSPSDQSTGSDSNDHEDVDPLDQYTPSDGDSANVPSDTDNSFEWNGITLDDMVLNEETGATLKGCFECADNYCEDKLLACANDEKCLALVQCVLGKGCVTSGSDYDMLCVLGCGLENGITSPSDPSAALAMDVGPCAVENCSEECGQQ